MASKVYFTNFRATYRENLPKKLARLVKTAGMLEGIDFVVVIMGMYGIGEVLHNVEHNVHLDLGKPNFKLREYFPTRKELKEVSMPMLRGSLIGTVIGILPAAGGTIATFLASLPSIQNSSR